MTKAKQQHPAYTGELARPIRPVTGEELFTFALTLRELATGKTRGGVINQFAVERVTSRLMEKLPLLFRFFHIEEGNYAALVVALATRHVPGFTVATARPGAKQRWTPWETALLQFDIEATQSQRQRRSFAHAARLVAKRGHWNGHLRKGTNPGETLRRRALSADPRLARIVHEQYSQSQADNQNLSPEQFVRNYLAMKIRIGNIGGESIFA